MGHLNHSGVLYYFPRKSVKEIPEKLLMFYEQHKKYDCPFRITIGTDSQAHGRMTKIATVVVITCEGHGGIFFYKERIVTKIKSVKEKLYTETQDSLEAAGEIADAIDNDEKYLEMSDSCPISIHVDAGNSKKGKTWSLIPEITGWVQMCGYDCKVKPESCMASKVADRVART